MDIRVKGTKNLMKPWHTLFARMVCQSTLWRSLDFDRWLRNWIVGMKFSVVLTSQDP